MIRVLLMAVFLLVPSFAYSSNTIVISTGEKNEAFPPYIFYEGERASGILFEVLYPVADKHNYTIKEYKKFPRKRLESFLKDGTIGASFQALEWMQSPDDFLYSDTIVTSTDTVVLHRDSPDISSPEDLFGKKLLTNIGFFYPFLQPHFDKGKITRQDLTSGTHKILEMIQSKRAYGGVLNKAGTEWYMKKNNLQGTFKITDVKGGSAKFRLFFNKKHKDFHEIFNRELSVMKQNGELTKILNKYR